MKGKMKKNKFYTPPTFKQRLNNLKYGILFWKGRKKGMIHTRDITLDDLRYIFFPKGFEKYGYLGTQIWNEDNDYFKALYPLVLALDHEAKPKYCPRWFLRFLHVFGNDKSIVRIRNRRLAELHDKLTKGIGFIDWKTKWEWYDLRISIHAPKHLQDLADDIEHGFYQRGYRQELIDELKQLNPDTKPGWNIEEIKKQIEIEEEKLENEQSIIDYNRMEEESEMDNYNEMKDEQN
jgi:hypothetical protein